MESRKRAGSKSSTITWKGWGTMDELAKFRKAKDELFSSDPDSPLTYEQKREFKGLKYFPPNPKLRLEVSLQEFPSKDPIAIQTTTGSVQHYRRFGKIIVEAEGLNAELTVYKDERSYFLPFVDLLSGKETYPAGRYLEPKAIDGGRFIVDFNYAYNPYCAYNESWSCPITPFENHIKIPIRAGEKIFHE
jgi:uncharacterized protein (DUF1684 family)